MRPNAEGSRESATEELGGATGWPKIAGRRIGAAARRKHAANVISHAVSVATSPGLMTKVGNLNLHQTSTAGAARARAPMEDREAFARRAQD